MPAAIPFLEIFPLNKGENILFFENSKDNLIYPAHYHSEYEITLITAGQGITRTVGNTIAEINPDELVLLGPYLLHDWEKKNNTLDKNIQRLTINFTAKAIAHIKHLEVEPVEKMLRSSTMEMVFPAHVATEVKEKLIGLRLLSDKKIIAVLSDVLNIMAGSAYVHLTNQNIQQTQDKKLEGIIKFVRSNFSDRITLDDIIRATEMSHATFNRFIKKNTGKTFVGFLNSIRIAYASRWLSTTDLSVAEIAVKSGFGTLSNFNRNFRNSKGCTPLQYREKFFGSYRYL